MLCPRCHDITYGLQWHRSLALILPRRLSRPVQLALDSLHSQGPAEPAELICPLPHASRKAGQGVHWTLGVTQNGLLTQGKAHLAISAQLCSSSCINIKLHQSGLGTGKSCMDRTCLPSTLRNMAVEQAKGCTPTRRHRIKRSQKDLKRTGTSAAQHAQVFGSPFEKDAFVRVQPGHSWQRLSRLWDQYWHYCRWL